MCEQPEMRRRPDGAGQIAGELKILRHNIERPASGERPERTDRGILSKVRLAPALSGTICARTPRSIPALAPISIPSSAAIKLV